jgi:hypothetical protein
VTPRAEQRTGAFALAAVVAAFAGLCLLVGQLHRFYAYDEAIYLSQIYPGPALPFTAPRARGLVWLVAPLGWADAPLPVVRAYLLLLNCGLMYLGFRTWLPLLGRRALLAAAAFALSWPALYQATEVFPNLPAAMCAVAAAGYLAQSAARSTARSATRPLLGAGASLALMAAIRPTEAVFVAGGLCVAALLLAGDTWRRVNALLAGLAIGWLPWLVEAQARFGGPAQRLADAATNVSGGVHPRNILRQLALTDGPTSAPIFGAVPGIPAAGVAWWAALTAGLIVTIGAAWAAMVTRLADRPSEPASARRPAGTAIFGSVAALAGVASAGQYLLLTGVVEARFLLPAYALLTLALCSLLPAAPAPWQVNALVVAVLAGFGGWQVATASRLSGAQEKNRDAARSLAQVLTTQAAGRPCFFVSEEAFPVIGFASGCRGARLDPLSPLVYVHDDPGGAPLYALSASDPSDGLVQPVPGTARRLRAEGGGSWWIFVVPRTAVVVNG